MSEDIEQRLKSELQTLLEENPELEPTQLIDGDNLIILAVENGIPRLTERPRPESSDYDIPCVTDLHGTPIYRIYNLLQTLKFLDEERNQTDAADILARTSEEAGTEIRIDPPCMPPMPEIITSIVSGNTDLQNKPSQHGMYRNLESLHHRFRELLKAQPNLEPLRLSTAKKNVEISVVDGDLRVQPTGEPCQPYLDVRDTPQVRLYTLDRSVRGLERKLYGHVSEIKVGKSSGKSKAEEKLVCSLAQVDCGNVSILIRRSRKTLFLSGSAKHIIYGDLKIVLTEEGTLRQEDGSEPVGYATMEYGALPPNVKQVLNALFAYLSTRSSKQAEAP